MPLPLSVTSANCETNLRASKSSKSAWSFDLAHSALSKPWKSLPIKRRDIYLSFEKLMNGLGHLVQVLHLIELRKAFSCNYFLAPGT